jgi:hypothetical protein
MLPTNYTNGNYTMRQLKLPLGIEKLIDRWNLVSHTTFQWSVCHPIKSSFFQEVTPIITEISVLSL